jgi:hypothetical protein
MLASTAKGAQLKSFSEEILIIIVELNLNDKN